MKAVKKARPAHRKTAHRLNGALFVVICPHRPERPDNGIGRLPGPWPSVPAPPERRKEATENTVEGVETASEASEASDICPTIYEVLVVIERYLKAVLEGS